ncbi:MAG: Stk1 family PASTA domain-containing Ser/Thr kinase, partial [Clostridiales bacterium]|nr:Stk1 family PASTA domain-containing Ser/Thr kinase [Clostridiales bacterium]
AASLSHPNIVSIFDVGHEGSVHYIVMEYVDGITLKDYITENGTLDWREATGIAIQICSAIEHAHKNNIIHRDIKPHNILLTKEGIAKVTDFGIARAVSSSTITMVGSTIGSVHYFSPEQARGSYTDEKSDLYSLGITIYEMITGKVPFDGESPVAVALKHIQNEAVRPGDLVGDIPDGISDIVMKAIMKDKELRYQNATELLADLQQLVRDPDSKFAVNLKPMKEFPTRKMQAIGAKPSKSKGKADYDDDEEAEPEEVKKDKLSIILGIVTGLVILVILFYVGFKIIIPIITPENDDFTVEDYTGKLFTQVSEELKAEGIEAVEDKHVYSDTVDAGTIISQNPEADKTLKKGSTIKFEVSDGPELTTIPDVTAKESRVADQLLKDADLTTRTITENSDTVTSGTVIRTEPAANEQVKPGTEVVIVESLGPVVVQIPVPDITGKTRAEAEKILTGNKLLIGNIIPADIKDETAIIKKQYPLSGTMVDEGTAVEITFETVSAADDTGTQGTGTPAGNNNGTGDGTTQGTVISSQKWSVALDSPEKYGAEIALYVEATPAETNQTVVVCNSKVAKASFPYSVDIPGTKGRTTHVIIRFDGVLIAEWDMQF